MTNNGDKNEHIEDAGSELWKGFKNGSLTDFESIYKLYFPVLMKYGTKLCRNITLVEDCIQDLFIELWERKAKLADVQSVKFYLLISFRRKILKHLSNHRTLESTDSALNYSFEVILSEESSIISAEQSHLRNVQIQSALEELTDREREVIYLRVFENLSYQEIVSMLSITEKTSRNHFFNGIEKLRKLLSLKDLFILLAISLIQVYLMLVSTPQEKDLSFMAGRMSGFSTSSFGYIDCE